jgi:hypothetical protein
VSAPTGRLSVVCRSECDQESGQRDIVGVADNMERTLAAQPVKCLDL